MNIISKYKRFKLILPSSLYHGKDLEGQKVETEIYLIEGKEATILDLAYAISEFYSSYDYDSRKWAPKIHTLAYIKDKTYEFNTEWYPEFDGYVDSVANQIKL